MVEPTSDEAERDHSHRHVEHILAASAPRACHRRSVHITATTIPVMMHNA